jgi:hypothetical protein
VVNNGVATLQVGDSVPIATGTATVLSANNAVVNTINYQNTGIILRVVPRVHSNGTVALDIEQEISEVAPSSAAGTLTPTISQRKVKSTLSVSDGQTVLLAGLISETQSVTRSGIPLLDQIPNIGNVLPRIRRNSSGPSSSFHPATGHTRWCRCAGGGRGIAFKAERQGRVRPATWRRGACNSQMHSMSRS